MKNVLAMIEAESEALRCVKLSLLTENHITGMHFQFEAYAWQDYAYDIYKTLSEDERQVYYKLMSIMTFIEEMI